MGETVLTYCSRNPRSHTSCIFELCYVVLLHVQYAWIFPILFGLFETSRPGCQHILGSTSVRIWNDSYQLFISWNTLIVCSKHISKFEGTSFDSRAGFQFSSPAVSGGKWSMQVAHMLKFSDLHPTCQSCPVRNKDGYCVKQALLKGIFQAKMKSQPKKTLNMADLTWTRLCDHMLFCLSLSASVFSRKLQCCFAGELKKSLRPQKRHPTWIMTELCF